MIWLASSVTSLIKKCNLTLAMSPTCHSNSPLPILLISVFYNMYDVWIIIQSEMYELLSSLKFGRVVNKSWSGSIGPVTWGQWSGCYHAKFKRKCSCSACTITQMLPPTTLGAAAYCETYWQPWIWSSPARQTDGRTDGQTDGQKVKAQKGKLGIFCVHTVHNRQCTRIIIVCKPLLS